MFDDSPARCKTRNNTRSINFLLNALIELEKHKPDAGIDRESLDKLFVEMADWHDNYKGASDDSRMQKTDSILEGLTDVCRRAGVRCSLTGLSN